MSEIVERLSGPLTCMLSDRDPEKRRCEFIGNILTVEIDGVVDDRLMVLQCQPHGGALVHGRLDLRDPDRYWEWHYRNTGGSE